MIVPHDFSEQAQKEELILIVGKLSVLLATVKNAFSHGKDLPIDHLQKLLRDLLEEIAFTVVKADKHLPGEPIRNRKPMLRYQSILSHLQILTSVIATMVDHIQKQIEDRISFYEQTLNQTVTLFAQQKMILCTIEEAIRTGDHEHLRTVCSSCNELTRLCRRINVVHEKCVMQGHCNPNTALRLLTFLDLMHSFVHHERESVRLLVRWMGRRNQRSSR